MMAQAAAELADLTVLTAEDPRTEVAGGHPGRNGRPPCDNPGGVKAMTFWRVPDRGEALRFAVRLARPGDILLACGKGHEQSMCFGEIEYPWDDRTALRAALGELLDLPGTTMPLLPTAK